MVTTPTATESPAIAACDTSPDQQVHLSVACDPESLGFAAYAIETAASEAGNHELAVAASKVASMCFASPSKFGLDVLSESLSRLKAAAKEAGVFVREGAAS